MTTQQPPNKKQRLDNNNEEEQTTTSKTLIHLSGDELSNILSFMNSACDRIMMTCTCRSLYLCISQMVKEQSPINGSLATIWRRMDRWKIDARDGSSSTNELLEILNKVKSFHNVTHYVDIHFYNLKEEECREKMYKLLCIETGKGYREMVYTRQQSTITFIKSVPDIVGFSLKQIFIQKFDVLNLDDLAKCCSQVTYLNIHTDEIRISYEKKAEMPQFPNLTYLQLDCDVKEEDVANQFALMTPNLKVLTVLRDIQPIMKFVDHCSKLTTFEMNDYDFGCSLNDADVLTIVKRLPLLKLLFVKSRKITGRVLTEIGAYAKNLEYLCLGRVRSEEYEEPVFSETKLGGVGQLDSLKEFNFVGQLSEDEEDEQSEEEEEEDKEEEAEEEEQEQKNHPFDPEILFDSVIELCPNIQFINVHDYGGELSYPRNLYTLIPTNRMKELILYPYKHQTKRGQNATDVLIEMRTGWEQIAQNERVEALVLHQATPMSVLARCSWPNVEFLVIKNYSKEWYELIENENENENESSTTLKRWLLCLMKACPNFKSLKHNEEDKRLKSVLDNTLSKVDKLWPNTRYKPRRTKQGESWSGNWLENGQSSNDRRMLWYDDMMQRYLRGE